MWSHKLENSVKKKWNFLHGKKIKSIPELKTVLDSFLSSKSEDERGIFMLVKGLKIGTHELINH